MTSPTTAAAREFVAAHIQAAKALGRELAELVDDPEAFIARLRAGLEELADPAYRQGQQFVAPGLSDAIGVRMPLLTAIRNGLARGSRRTHSASLLLLVNRLLRGSSSLEERVLAFELLERTLQGDPERTWQLLREGARRANEWITVDSLAHAYAKGILAEPVRWAEIEQLAYSPSRWERRLVASTIATIPFADRSGGRRPEIVRRALPIIANLIGDAEPDVQKALAWALRSLALADRDAVAAFLRNETERAVASSDGHRAWVIRDALVAIDPDHAAVLRARLGGIRRAADSPSTSQAAAIADAFWAQNPDLLAVRPEQGARQGAIGVRR